MLQKNYKTFIQVADSKSFSSAANLLFISPVSVMKQINQIESELNVKLFTRDSQGVALTQSGKFLYEMTKKLLHESSLIMKQTKELNKSSQIEINMGISIMRPGEFLIRNWRDNSFKFGNYNLQMVSFNDEDVSKASPSTKIGQDFDFIVGPCDAEQWYEHYNIEVLGYEKLKIGVPVDHPLAKKKSLEPQDLENQVLIMPSREASIINKMTFELEQVVPSIEIVNLSGYYSPNTFSNHPDNFVLSRNSFENIMPTHRLLDIDWSYKSPIGIIYPQNATDRVTDFISVISK